MRAIARTRREAAGEARSFNVYVYKYLYICKLFSSAGGRGRTGLGYVSWPS